MRILIDVDGVLALLHEKCQRVWLEETGNVFTPDMQTHFKFADNNHFGQFFDECLDRPGFMRDLEVAPGAVDFVTMIHNLGLEIWIVTAVRDCAQIDRTAWVREHFPFIPWSRIICTFKKEAIEGEIILDDGVHNLEVGDRRLRLLWDQFHNQAEERFTRVTSWDEAFQAILELAVREIPHAYA